MRSLPGRRFSLPTLCDVVVVVVVVVVNSVDVVVDFDNVCEIFARQALLSSHLVR